MKYLPLLFLFITSVLAQGQVLSKLSIRIGPSISGQIKTPTLFADGGIKFGFSFTGEPTIMTFGAKKQFDFNTDISFIQKGGFNYSPVITNAGIGSENYSVTINYISFSPTFKFIFLKRMFVKAGPRIDVLVNYKIEDKFSCDLRTRKDFNSTTYGITYGAGICFGKKSVGFVCEFDGQHDFSKSSYNPASGQSFKNYCFLINAGVIFSLSKKSK